MKISIQSDLHLEFNNPYLPMNAGVDVLILSGDICPARDLFEHNDFFKHVSSEFKQVLMVAGNHESYHYCIDDTYEDIKLFLDKFSNITLLENETKTIDDVLFVGFTLWTNMHRKNPRVISMLGNYMNDFNYVTKLVHGEEVLFKPEDALARHETSINFLNGVLESNKDQKTVVIGHHAPSYLSKKSENEWDHVINGGYSSDLSDIMLDNPQIKLWTHGHIHKNYDYMIGDCRIVCNPFGYHGHAVNRNFNPNLIIEV